MDWKAKLRQYEHDISEAREKAEKSKGLAEEAARVKNAEMRSQAIASQEESSKEYFLLLNQIDAQQMLVEIKEQLWKFGEVERKFKYDEASYSLTASWLIHEPEYYRGGPALSDNDDGYVEARDYCEVKFIEIWAGKDGKQISMGVATDRVSKYFRTTRVSGPGAKRGLTSEVKSDGRTYGPQKISFSAEQFIPQEVKSKIEQLLLADCVRRKDELPYS